MASLLDRETQDKYTLKVKAVDGGGKSATVDVEIAIMDVNDSIPKFRQTSYSVKLAEDAEIGSEVFNFQAYDTDKGDFLNYEIVSGNEDGSFTLSVTQTGSAKLLLGSPLDYSDKKTYILKIKEYWFPILSLD